MIITNASLVPIYQSFNLTYQSGYTSVEPWANRVATITPSSARETVFGFLAQIPRMREWLGDRVLNNVAQHAYTLANKDFELTIEVGRNDVVDDQIGSYKAAFEMLGRQARKYPDDLIVTRLQNGHLELCYDGQYFFDTDHPVSKFKPALGSAQQNYWASGKALTHDNFGSVRAAMMAFRGEDNKPMGVRPNLLVVPPALEQIARQILMADYLPSTAGTATQTNIWKGMAELLVVPELAGQDTTWYLLDTSMPIKPFVFANREAATFQAFDALNSEHVFKTNKLIYGARARGNAGHALWFLAAKAAA